MLFVAKRNLQTARLSWLKLATFKAEARISIPIPKPAVEDRTAPCRLRSAEPRHQLVINA